MARWITSLSITLGAIFLLEYYAFQALKMMTKKRSLRWAWLIAGILVYLNFIYVLLILPRSLGQTKEFQVALGMLITILIPKIVILVLLFGEDTVRWFQKMTSWLGNSPTRPIAGRRAFVSKAAMSLATIPFASFLFGIIQGRYNYKIFKYQLTFSDLPDAFDGFTITQISDIHSGSFTNKEKIQYGVDMINSQQSDLLLFTGDIVNNRATEMDQWVDMFESLKAPYGKYAILGNHDYAEYIGGISEEEKEIEFQKIKKIHPKIGFDLLCNEHRYIEKGGQKIALIGVENWGKNFKQAGDLNKASKGVRRDDFKVLMSHDPSHWDAVIKEDEFNYQLTLSGHTHGLQMGIEIPGWIKWSPSKYAYTQWAGLYKESDRYVNVNRGFGYHAFPGRVGIWPEITVIELRKI